MADLGHIAGKLQRLVLMLSSNQPGEVAAANAIERTLKSAGADWHDHARVIASPPSVKARQPNFDESRDGASSDWRSMRDHCLRHEARLREREREFLNSLKKWRGHPTPKQRDWLQAIYDRLTS
jgi:hypothetical protein